MTVGSDTLKFAYDASGTPLSVEYNGTTYYYVTNIQGDVISIVNTSGTSVVEYTYDAWGNILTTTGSMASSLGAANPLRYRGYVYDQEYGFYYLQSRYYNPEVGRFLNADALTSTGQGLLGNNMFAYCNNDPVIFVDYVGTACVDALRRGGDRLIIGGAGSGGAVTLLFIDWLINLFASIKNKSKTGKPNVGNSKNGKNGKEGKKGQQPEPPNVEFPGYDPTKAPDGYVWKGPDSQGGKNGGYKNPNGKDTWHPDLDHPKGIDPHWDYNDAYGHKWRVFPNHIEFVK